jgi:predicted metal-dependent peptidase
MAISDIFKRWSYQEDNSWGAPPKEFKPPKLKLWDGTDKKAAEQAEKKIQIARVRLIEKVPFFGRMTLLLTLRATHETPTMGTDGEHLFYNPYFVNDHMTSDELLAVTLHEVLHCALLHLWRKGKKRAVKWNVACDLVINPMVMEMGMTLPKGTLFDEQYENMSAEKVYKLLPNPKVIKINGDWYSDKSKWGKKHRDNKGKGKGDGKGKKAKDKGKQGSKGKSKGDKKQGKGKGSQKGQGKGQGKPQDVWQGKNKEVMDRIKKGKDKEGKGKGEKLEDYWKGVFNSAIRGRSKGDIPAYMKRFYEELEAKKDWKKELQTYLSASSDDFNFSSPDRRFLEDPFYLPNLQDIEKLEDVVIAVDTSGSISTWQFNHFISEVKEILTVFPKFRGWFIDCDAQINQVLEIKPNEEFKPKMKGGGGTDFNPVFDKIKEEDWNPKVLIYLTDGYGDFPDEEPPYPTIWLIDSEIEPPFGQKIQYEYDEGDEYRS